MTATRKVLMTAAALSIFAFGAAHAAGTEESGVIVCVNDKWDEKEIAKDHKVVDYAGRCVKAPDDAKAPKMTEDCAGKYEYMPDKSWKASGGCTGTFPGGDKVFSTWEEGSASKEWTFKVTGGTGKYEKASGGGTYSYENLTDTLAAGRYKGKW
ncbi:MAG: hypothetical protein ACT4OU_10095 [Hyphomicrobium sp.]